MHFSKMCKVFCVVSIAIVTTSCNKFLDKKPDATLQVPTSLSDLQALLDYSNYMNLQRTPSFGESSSDDYFLVEEDLNAYTVEYQKIYTWNREDYSFPNSWSNAYLPVFNANFCLDQLKEIEPSAGTISAWNNVKGSSLFYRSYYFLGLLWDFANAYDSATSNEDRGIVLRLSADYTLPSRRSSVKECYDQVITDAKESLMYLPDNGINMFRPTKVAAYALLARAYLSMRVYDSAFKYASLTLSINSSLIDYNGDEDINGDISNSIPFLRFTKETLFYTEMEQADLLNNYWVGKVDTVLYDTYAADDLRKIAYFDDAGDYHKFKCIYTGSNAYYFTGLATDEIFLIKAEAAARLNRVETAMDALNTLLEKRWKTGAFEPVTAATKSEALEIIVKERRKTLIDRGLRWIDIKRYNRDGAGIKLTRRLNGQQFELLPNANYYALPLPKDIIDATGMQQNPR